MYYSLEDTVPDSSWLLKYLSSFYYVIATNWSGKQITWLKRKSHGVNQKMLDNVRSMCTLVLAHLGQRQKILLISTALLRPSKYFAKVTVPDKASGLFPVILRYQQLEQGTAVFWHSWYHFHQYIPAWADRITSENLFSENTPCFLKMTFPRGDTLCYTVILSCSFNFMAFQQWDNEHKHWFMSCFSTSNTQITDGCKIG